jgi:hypothetical protein
MLILSTTSDKIQVVLGGNITTNQLTCFASFRDTNTTSITPGRNVVNTNNTTAVDLVGSPASSKQRIVDYLSVYNKDTANATVTINLVSTSTNYTQYKATLLSGEKLEYQHGEGFKTIATDGGIKIIPNQSGPPSSLVLNSTMISADVTNTTTSYADITSLSFSVTSGKQYYFKFVIPYTTSGTGNGAGFSINGPTVTHLSYYSFYPSAAVANTVTYNSGLSSYDSPAASTLNTGTLSALAFVEGIITPSANGTVIGRFRSENAAGNSIVAKAGSVVFYQEIN